MYRFVVAVLVVAPLMAGAKEPDVGLNVTNATVDMSYDWDDVVGAPGLHVFDINQNGFSLHQVNVTVGKQFPEGVSATFNALFGDDAAVISPNGDDFDLVQGFFGYTVDSVTLFGGRFVTLAGAETIDPAGNLNASRSLLFLLQPRVHTGIRATLKVADTLSLTAGINNGAIDSKVDNNKNQTLEAQVAYQPVPALGMFLTGYIGNETATGSLNRSLLDLVIRANVTDTLTLVLNADYFSIEDPFAGSLKQTGLAGYANFRFGKFRVAPRLEYLDLDTGVPSDPTFWVREWTLTAGFAPSPHLEFLAELRNDTVDLGGGGLPPTEPGGGPNDSQYSGTVKAIFKF